MTLELIHPEGRPTPESYTQVIAATGSRLVFVAGQAADDAQGNLVGPATCVPKPARPSPTSAGASSSPEPVPSR